MKVADILRVKGNTLFTVTPDESLATAVSTMAEKDIGSLVVMEHGDLVGMLTFREVIVAIVENGGQVGGTQVRKAMGPKMTSALIDALREQGYEAEVIAVPSGYKDADYVDVTRLPTRDPVLYVQFGETGMDSGRLSSYYLPRVNIGATLSAPDSGDTLFSTSLYYGADSVAPMLTRGR